MNTATYNPPPAFEPTPSEPQSPRGGWIKPLLITVGVLVVLSVLVQAVFAGIRIFNQSTSSQAASMTGVTSLQIEASAGDFSIEYGDTSEAVLTTTGTRDWELAREGDTLVVEQPGGWFGLFGGCFGWCFGGHEVVTLTLPAAYETNALDLDVALSAGSFKADGAYRELAIEVNAGEARVNGATEALDAEVNAGRLVLGLLDVREADFEINAGRIEGQFTGSAPTSIDLSVSAGSFDLVVPSAPYRVSSNVSAGSFDNNLTSTGSGNEHVISVSVSAGSAKIRD